MKPIRLITLALTALLALSLGSVHAQPAEAGSSADGAGPASSSKSFRAANRQLAKAVSRVLSRTKGLDSSGITVRARSGAVTLEGSVPDASQIDQAAQAAASVAGVSSVKSALTLREVGH